MFLVDNTICIISKMDKDKITFKTIENHQYGLRRTVSKHLKGRGKIGGARIGWVIIPGNMVFKKKNLLLELREDERKRPLRRLPSIPLAVIKWH